MNTLYAKEGEIKNKAQAIVSRLVNFDEVQKEIDRRQSKSSVNNEIQLKNCIQLSKFNVWSPIYIEMTEI